MSFPHGTVPTAQRVQPTPLYEALVAFALGAALWRLRDRISPTAQFATFVVTMGVARFLVEFARVNPTAAAGLSQPQLWSLGLAGLGIVLFIRHNSIAARSALPGGQE